MDNLGTIKKPVKKSSLKISAKYVQVRKNE